ncbi:MAG: type II toxin-antitoxin system VapC family toxin [Propionibacteriaceae bacterium]|jgi:predicted nucleic acid-binding protein|nr:type II toxin-antitoxin system VapC family toxin [Propionibacteriaceae bacterium]
MTAGTKGLLDTSVVIALETLDPDDLPDLCLISAITLAELSAGPLVASDPQERATRQARLQQTERDFDPLPFDAACARAFGRVSADLRAAGRKAHARAYDAMIAATAIAHRLPLYTLNASDFAYISELDVRDLTAR